MSDYSNSSDDLSIDEFISRIERDLKDTGDYDVNKTISTLNNQNMLIESKKQK